MFVRSESPSMVALRKTARIPELLDDWTTTHPTTAAHCARCPGRSGWSSNFPEAPTFTFHLTGGQDPTSPEINSPSISIYLFISLHIIFIYLSIIIYLCVCVSFLMFSLISISVSKTNLTPPLQSLIPRSGVDAVGRHDHRHHRVLVRPRDLRVPKHPILS